jgi:hypothetical protein
LYVLFAQLVLFYKWEIGTVKELPVRERRYWRAVMEWKNERARWRQQQETV